MDKQMIIAKLQEGLNAQFSGVYSWEDMIDDLSLTPEEKEWAKAHTYPNVSDGVKVK